MSAAGAHPSQRAAWIELGHAVEPADASVGRLLSRLGPEELLERLRQGTSGLRHQEGLAARLASVSADQAIKQADRHGVRIITRVDREWPSQLDALGTAAPLALWVHGAADLRLLALRSIAMVGARACTAYGEEVTRSWSAHLASDGWAVVSGGAFGIDAAAHRGALGADGVTVAVMAGGVDVAYPRAHAALLATIADRGLLISEVPMGEAVRRQRFLSRNRIIAALSRATVVVEAAERSGTTATARAAAALLRPVLAVPGPVTSPASVGCHRLIVDGVAVLAAEVADVVSAVDLTAQAQSAAEHAAVSAPSDPQAREQVRRDALDPREATVLDAFPARGWVSLPALVRASGLGVAEVVSAAALLVGQGWIDEGPLGWSRTRVAIDR